MATTGSISASPTKRGACTTGWTSGTSFSTICKNFVDSGTAIDNTGSSRAVFFYGFNFEELRSLENVRITNIVVTAKTKATISGAYFGIRLCYGFNTSTSSEDTSTYTDLGDGSVRLGEGSHDGTYSADYTTLPNTLTWINNNLESFLDGYTNNSFGIRAYLSHVYLYSLTISVTYTYGNETFTISTSVTPEGAGTVSPSTQEVESGATVSVTATPATGYKFSHWQVDGADTDYTDPTLSGTITADILCTAVFEKLPPKFTAAEMIYSGNPISNSNKVVAGESFVISVGVT